MPKRSRKFQHGAHAIDIVEKPRPQAPRLIIDALEVSVRREEGGGYSTEMIMFKIFPSLDELARAVVDNSPVFLALGDRPAPPAQKPMGGMS